MANSYTEDNESTSRGTKTQSTAQLEPEPALTPDYGVEARIDSTNEPEELSIFKARFLSGDWNADISAISAAEAGPIRRALVIAISYGFRYPPARLKGTYIDAYKVTQLLVAKFGYKDENICVLADVLDENGHENPKRSPTRSNIEQALRWLCMGTTANDYRFLFFAGHGYRRKEQTLDTFYEGIMPVDVAFKTYTTCETCTCGAREGTTTLQAQTDNVIPYSGSIIWGYRINEILASSLTDGAKLTVVFDCCYSGGTLKNSIASPWDAIGSPGSPGSPRARGTSVVSAVGSALQSALSYLSISNKSESLVMEGNLLRLPRSLDVNDEGDPVLKPALPPTEPIQSIDQVLFETAISQKLSLPDNRACVPHINVAPKVREFGPKCRILCWAACRDYQRAWEDPKNGGAFTSVFFDHLTEMHGSTYGHFIKHIREVFRAPTTTNNDGGPEYQKPQLFTSGNMGIRAGDKSRLEDMIFI